MFACWKSCAVPSPLHFYTFRHCYSTTWVCLHLSLWRDSLRLITILHFLLLQPVSLLLAFQHQMCSQMINFLVFFRPPQWLIHFVKMFPLLLAWPVCTLNTRLIHTCPMASAFPIRDRNCCTKASTTLKVDDNGCVYDFLIASFYYFHSYRSSAEKAATRENHIYQSSARCSWGPLF